MLETIFKIIEGLQKFFYRKTVGHVFTKPVQIEETTLKNYH